LFPGPNGVHPAGPKGVKPVKFIMLVTIAEGLSILYKPAGPCGVNPAGPCGVNPAGPCTLTGGP